MMRKNSLTTLFFVPDLSVKCRILLPFKQQIFIIFYASVGREGQDFEGSGVIIGGKHEKM